MKKSLTYLVLALVSCTSPIEIEVFQTSEVLVVEASITNEMKQHEIFLTKAVPLDGTGPETIAGASVWITDDAGNQYDFLGGADGKYISSSAFAIGSGVSYILHIETADGKSYESSAESLPVATQIDEIFGTYVNIPSTQTNEIEEGIQFFVNASSADPASQVFNVRIAYDEDYIITVPYSSPYVYTSEMGIVDREVPIQTCYKNLRSNELLIGSTSGQSQNSLLHFPVRLVETSEPNLRLRYALTIKQYSITSQAYRYYQDLKENNESGGGFQDRQKGSIVGNIVNVNDLEEVVLGYFEIAHVTEAREFFTPSIWREDGFRPNPLFRNCEYTMVADSVFTEDVQNDMVSLTGFNIHAISTDEVYTVLVPNRCSDCRFYGVLEKPDFWDQ